MGVETADCPRSGPCPWPCPLCPGSRPAPGGWRVSPKSLKEGRGVWLAGPRFSASERGLPDTRIPLPSLAATGDTERLCENNPAAEGLSQDPRSSRRALRRIQPRPFVGVTGRGPGRRTDGTLPATANSGPSVLRPRGGYPGPL